MAYKFKRKKEEGVPLTKGQALDAARALLGPNGFVSKVMDEFPSVFIRQPSGLVYLCGNGDTFEAALKMAANSPQAMEWMDREVEVGNEIAESVERLQKAQEKENAGKVKKFFENLVLSIKNKARDKVKHAEEYELWKEGREEVYQEALAKTKARAAIGPLAWVPDMEEERFEAKLQRRDWYNA